MKIIVGNWKMNGTDAELDMMIRALENLETDNKIIICPPFTMLGHRSEKIAMGAQDISQHDRGPYTGEVSAQMIAATNAKYVIVGHSERRQYHGETNDIVQQKAVRAIECGLVPIICVGATPGAVESDVRGSVPMNIGSEIIIAYEPQSAIGTGTTPTIDEIATAHDLIAKTLKDMGFGDTAILYGGSVNATNAAEITSVPNVDGVLVGTAALKIDGFLPITESVK